MKLTKFGSENCHLEKTDIFDCIVGDILPTIQVVNSFDNVTQSCLVEELTTTLWNSIKSQY